MPKTKTSEAPTSGAKLHDLSVEKYLHQCVAIGNPDYLQPEFVRLSADLAYWNVRYSETIGAHLRAKKDLGVVCAKLDILVREQLAASGVRTTEAMVKSTTESHDDYLEAYEMLITAEVEKARVYGILDAVRAKKEMLVSLGAYQRLEMQGDAQMRNLGSQQSAVERQTRKGAPDKPKTKPDDDDDL